MSLIKCEKCSEMYSDSYKRCPFCAEEEEFYGGKVKKRAHRKQETRHKTPSILGPIMVLVVLLIAFLVWLLALGGSQTISRIFGGETAPVVEDQQGSDQQDTQSTEPATQLEMDPMVLNLGIDESVQLKCTGGEGIEWTSSEPSVVTVTGDGEVTSHAEGTAIITATDSQGSTAVCSVTVSAEQHAESPTDTTTPTDTNKPTAPSSGTKVDLNKLEIKVPIYGTTLPKMDDGKFDTSMRVGESYQLEVGGVSGTVTWSSGNSNIASIASDGTLKAVGKGETTVTGTVGGSTFEILVRVS